MLTTIRTYTNVQKAYIVCGLLKFNNIPAEVQDTGTNSVFPSLDEDSGGASVMVAKSDMEKAEKLLQENGE